MTFNNPLQQNKKKAVALINESQNIRPNANLPVWIGAPAAYEL